MRLPGPLSQAKHPAQLFVIYELFVLTPFTICGAQYKSNLFRWMPENDDSSGIIIISSEIPIESE